MGKLIEIIAMSIGGISLFTVCFLGFAITSGKPLAEVPLVGPLLAMDPAEGPVVKVVSPADQIPTSARPKAEILDHTSGVLQTFSVQSPFSQVELRELADSLKDTKAELERRTKEVKTRGADLELKSEALDDREQRMAQLRVQYEEDVKELLLRESEIKRAEELSSDRDQRVYQNKASSLADLDPAEAVKRLETYKVEEVAKVLHAMEDGPAAEIVKVLPQDRWEEVVDRLSRLRADFPKDAQGNS